MDRLVKDVKGTYLTGKNMFLWAKGQSPSSTDFMKGYFVIINNRYLVC